jgi:hypothetical protein
LVSAIAGIATEFPWVSLLPHFRFFLVGAPPGALLQVPCA